ncbi:MAG: hypothetical protein GEV10_11675 [Streptosporangiales bacterium]|nr:hypothetical protein [Streptosporangiales bacterium]
MSHRWMHVPVRGTEVPAVRLGVDRVGERVGLAFTTEDRLQLAMGAEQHWITLDESALREMLRALGISRISVDPTMVLSRPRLHEKSA